ncbi:MAG: LysM peptidoglycan-binding domain-containing protein [Bacteroidales bacterium]|nr:LysM peptidoglycan-binding domain-containing protein [Bacteroidales bacterium]
MKRILTLMLTALCLAPIPLAAQAYKSTPVTISQEKVSKDGKVYFAHKVLDHQTLFSISRAYSVTYQDIVDANPGLDLSRGQIQTGQVLLIPEKEIPAESVVARGDAVAPVPESAPVVTQKPAQEAPTTSDYTVYTAKWYETLDMIAAKHNVSKDVLMAYNGLTSEQLSRHQRLRIPAHPETVEVPVTTPVKPAEVAILPETEPEEETLPEETETTVETTESVVDRIGLSLKDLFRRKQLDDKVRVGIILPFNAKGQLVHSSFDLYSGMLLAVRDLGKSGIKAELTVIDSKNPATPVTADKLDGFDLVIGPVAPDDLQEVLDISPRTTAVVSPLDPKAIELAGTYPNFIQAPSPADAQYDDIVDWVRESFKRGDRILLVKEKDAPPTPVADRLAESGLDYSTVEYTTRESHSALERMRTLMPPSGTSHVILAADREGFVNDLVRNLTLLSYKNLDIILYGPAKIRTYDIIEVENLHRANAHLSCSYFIDYNNPRIKDFLLSYRALFGAEPTQFAYQGYDIAYYFIRNFATSERDRERMTRLEDRKYTGLQSNFLISDDGNAGHVNRAVRRVVYGKDFTISLLSDL